MSHISLPVPCINIENDRFFIHTAQHSFLKWIFPRFTVGPVTLGNYPDRAGVLLLLKTTNHLLVILRALVAE